MSDAAAVIEYEDADLAQARAAVLDGEGAFAVSALERLIAEDAFSPELHYWLSAAYGVAGLPAKQVLALRKAETLHALQAIKDSGGDLVRLQQEPAYAADVAARFYQASLPACASIGFGRAALEPGASLQLLLSYGLSLQHQGRIEDACAFFQVAANAYGSARAHEFLLYATFFSSGGVERHAAEARRWAQLHAPPADVGRPFENDRNPDRPLRIGYVAPSFLGTQVRQFFTPVLEAHDPAAVTPVLYAADEATEIGLGAPVRGIGRLSDQQAAACIRDDRIDLLVDLWGHTAGGRMTLFALKPAPVQVSWINYIQTTGLAAIDYVIHCDAMRTPAAQALFAEAIWTIGPVMAPFRPLARAAVTPTPALRTGAITFASFNHPAKLSDETLVGWARVLRARPGSKLILKYAYFADPILQNATCARFAAHGVAPERLEFRGHSTGPEYLAQFGDVDLALDPSPCPGGTTTCDALAAGVPVLTLRGPDFYSRVGVAGPEPMGLAELVAEDWDDYVAKAVRLTEDLAALDALRARVRDRFETSPLRDEAGFTRRLEAAYREMFARWSGAA